MFDRRKKPPISTYDKSGKTPVIRSSICTGEQVAGFKDPISGIKAGGQPLLLHRHVVHRDSKRFQNIPQDLKGLYLQVLFL